ncbi:hypothetical protein [Maribacter sp. 2-571]|uniref:hypothetical protein n=1 Tax=Maribacter sp. 2-571 TaxID=3417569 RepID=UPI003D33462C
MKILLLALFLIPYLACNPNSGAVLEDTSDTAENTDETLADSSSVNPGEVVFHIKILETFDNKKDICGVSNDHVVSVEVLQVLERGMGISNIPRKKRQLLMNFMLAPKNLPSIGVLEVKARESLCMEVSKSYFTIISHKILD